MAAAGNHKHIKTAVAIVTVVMLLLISYIIGYTMGHRSNDLNAPVSNDLICTDDAKLCPDGSAVGRNALNCEFPECPDEQDFKMTL